MKMDKTMTMPRTLIIGILLVAIFLSLAGCGGDSPPQQQGQGKITGKVSSSSGVPLYNVAVTINGSDKSVLSDCLGNYTLTGIPTGNQKLSIVKNGYQSSQVDVVITENGSDVNVELNPNQNTATINGVINFEK